MSVVHVAVAVIVNSQQQVLVSWRHPHQHQGGQWEFPGGKVEINETVYDGLVREVYEELGLTVKQAEPLIQINHDYSDKSVLLDVWLVSDFSGEAQGREGQPFRWCYVDELTTMTFPPANAAIVERLQTFN